MRITIHILFILAAIFFVACKKKANIELPPAEEKLVVTSFISPGDSLLTVVVRSSLPKFNYMGNGYEDIKNALVKISGGGKTITLDYNDVYMAYMAPASEFPVELGHTYSLLVSAPGYEPVNAATSVPGDSLHISKFILDIINKDDQNLDLSYSFEVSDNPGQTNYVAMYHRPVYEDSLYGVTDPYLFSGYDGEFEDDENESHQVYRGQSRYTRSAYEQPFGKLYIHLHVLNCSREFYLYNRSVQQAGFSGYNPFSDPVMVYSNINGGFGCFGSYITSKRRFPVQ